MTATTTCGAPSMPRSKAARPAWSPPTPRPLARESLPRTRTAVASEAGGLSGAPLPADGRAPVSRSSSHIWVRRVPIVGVGGIASADPRVPTRIRSGATLVQVYTALIYEGPGTPRRPDRRWTRRAARPRRFHDDRRDAIGTDVPIPGTGCSWRLDVDSERTRAGAGPGSFKGFSPAGFKVGSRLFTLEGPALVRRAGQSWLPASSST